MKRNSYFPIRVADQIIWLVNFCNKLPGHSTALGLTAAQRDAGVADACWLVYVLQAWLPAVRAWSLSCTDAAKEAQSGDGTAAMVLPVFTAPAPPAGVMPVAPGALERTFALVQLIKDGGKCTETIGTDLGVIGEATTLPDLNAAQPKFKAKQTAEGVLLNWGWGGLGEFLDMIEIQVDRDGQGWKSLAHDSTPGYLDTFPIPAAPARWKYRAIYRVGDAQVGLWSSEVSIMVGG